MQVGRMCQIQRGEERDRDLIAARSRLFADEKLLSITLCRRFDLSFILQAATLRVPIMLSQPNPG